MRLMRGEDARPQTTSDFDTRQTLLNGCRAVFGKSELLVHESTTTTTVSKKPAKPFFFTGWKSWIGHPFFHGKKMRFIGGVQLKLGWLSSSRQAGLPVTPDFFFKPISRWFKVPFSPPSWRSLNPLRGSLKHPKKVTLNHQAIEFWGWFCAKNAYQVRGQQQNCQENIVFQYACDIIDSYDWPPFFNRLVSEFHQRPLNTWSELQCF